MVTERIWCRSSKKEKLACALLHQKLGVWWGGSSHCRHDWGQALVAVSHGAAGVSSLGRGGAPVSTVPRAPSSANGEASPLPSELHTGGSVHIQVPLMVVSAIVLCRSGCVLALA